MKLRLLKLLLPLLLITFGLTSLAFGIYLKYPNLNQAASAKTQVHAQSQSADGPIEISIPSASIKAPIIEGAIENGQWKLSNNAVLTLSLANQSKNKEA